MASPPLASLALSAFDCLSWGPDSCLTVHRTIWSECTWSGQSLLAFCKSPLSVSLGWFTNMINCALFYIFAFWLKSDYLSLFSQNIQFKCMFQLTFKVQKYCSIIVQLSSDNCSVIVKYSDPGNVFHVFQSRYQQPSTESINIIQVQDSPTFLSQ